MSYYDDEDVTIEFIDPNRKRDTKDDYVVDNVIYGKTNGRGTINNKNQRSVKTAAEEKERFYQWVRNLSPTSDTTREEISYTSSMKSVDPPERKTRVF